MSSVRRQYRLIVAGQKFEVETNMADAMKADVPGLGDTEKVVRTLHYACLRNRIENIPIKLGDFAGQLDDMEDLTDDDGPDADLDPTQATV